MTSETREDLAASLLEKWTSDLRAGVAPRSCEESQLLPAQQALEVLEVARWWAAQTRPDITPEAVAAIMNSVALRIPHLDPSTSEESADLWRAEPTFGTVLARVIEDRGVKLENLDRHVGFPKGTVARLLQGELPPHRISYTSFALLLRSLSLTNQRVRQAVREMCLDWVAAHFVGPTAALGRVEGDRGSTLDEARTRDTSASGSEEEQIAAFMAHLVRELDG